MMNKTYKTLFLIFTFCIFSHVASSQDKLQSEHQKIKKTKNNSTNTSRLNITKTKSPSKLSNSEKITQHSVKPNIKKRSFKEIFCKSCRESKTDCPDKSERKTAPYENIANSSIASKANLIRSSNSVHFDVINFEDVHLDIPAFKQFKNNMTDFTADGEHEFQTIIAKIKKYLGANYDGIGVTLRIMGSASQIPTSFDTELPRNNINPDGSSIIGKTTIKNNLKLAKARADELAKKIIKVYPYIEIITPTLDQIKLGSTIWTKEIQSQLNAAFIKKDKIAIKKIYEPFQKDQYVKVESKDKLSRSIQPESIKMYMLSTTPYLMVTNDSTSKPIRSVFIVSNKTYDEVRENKAFATVDDRDNYLDSLDIKIFSEINNGITRWYLLRGAEEMAAFKTPDKKERVFKLYKLGIVDYLNEQILEQNIIKNLSQNKP